MTPRNIFLSLCAAVIFGLSSATAIAHSKKEATTPSAGAVLESAPQKIRMTFDQPMRLTVIRLADDEGTEYKVTRTDGMKPVTEFEAEPAELGPGAYTVEWRGLSADGHPMEGNFSFKIRN